MNYEGKIKQVVSQVDEHELVELAKGLVQCESFTGHEQPIGNLLTEYARSHGLDCKTYDAAPRRPNTLMSIGGDNSFGLLLNGHIDIDPVVQGWTVEPFAGIIRDGLLYGAGIANMKAADAAMIEAVLAVKRTGIRLRKPLGASLVCGELQGGFGTIRLIEAGVRTEAAIVGEPTCLDIETFHYGIRRMRIHITGRAAHLAYGDNGLNAIEEASKVTQALTSLGLTASKLALKPLSPVINIGGIRGGISEKCEEWRPSIIPDTAIITADVRLPCDADETKIVSYLKAEIQRVLSKETKSTVELLKPPEHYPRPSYSAPEKSPLVLALAKAHEAIVGKTPKCGDLGRISLLGSDAPYFAKAGAQTAVYGPGNPERETAADEYVPVAEMLTAAKVYSALAADLCSA